MALYEFKCSVCGIEFEVERPFGASGKARCPSCGSTKTDKIFSATGIVFKGGGFYATDSRSKSDSGRSDSGKPAGKDKDGGKPVADKASADKPAGDGGKDKPAADTSAPKKDSSSEKQ